MTGPYRDQSQSRSAVPVISRGLAPPNRVAVVALLDGLVEEAVVVLLEVCGSGPCQEAMRHRRLELIRPIIIHKFVTAFLDTTTYL